MTSLYPTLGLDPLGLKRGETKDHESETGAVEEKIEGREGAQYFFFLGGVSRIRNK